MYSTRTFNIFIQLPPNLLLNYHLIITGDEEVTIIERVGIMGQLREKSDMNEFKRVSGQKGEAHG